MARGQLGAHRREGVLGDPELCQTPLGRDVGLAKVPEEGLAHALGLDRATADLDGVDAAAVGVVLCALDLRHGAVVDLEHSAHALAAPRVPDLRHAALHRDEAHALGLKVFVRRPVRLWPGLGFSQRLCRDLGVDRGQVLVEVRPELVVPRLSKGWAGRVKW